ncbi:hypothetical protein SJDPG2_00695 [Porphyromonas gingivalis SJD2]|nr:hypothetical protein SJDPG2_00695 [Porphyromonas gingivalis SJD2]
MIAKIFLDESFILVFGFLFVVYATDSILTASRDESGNILQSADGSICTEDIGNRRIGAPSIG